MEVKDDPELTLHEACKIVCQACRNDMASVWDGRMHPYDVGDVDPEPVYLPKRYYENHGVAEGWHHKTKYGELIECKADELLKHFAA